MRILLTNDDGIRAEGLLALERVFSETHEVWTVAPEREQSGASHKLTLSAPLRVFERGPRRFAVEGTPTDAMYLALYHLLPERPDLVFSGVNHGPNMGEDVLYSGTVAAAMEGALAGIPSVALSLAAFRDFRFDAAAEAARRIAARLERGGPERGEWADGKLLNVNVPQDAVAKRLEFRLTRLGKRRYRQSVEEFRNPRGKRFYWIGGNPDGSEPMENGDIDAVERGFVSVTPLTLDMTAYDILEKKSRLESELNGEDAF